MERHRETAPDIMGYLARFGFGLCIAVSVAGTGAMAQGDLSAYQGTWLERGPECAEVFSDGGKGTAFKKPVDIFVPAIIVSGGRLRTPSASCRIKSIRPAGDRQLLVLDCANAVAGNEVRVLMALQPDGSLKRFSNEQDTLGTRYERCSR
ncbi:hypothetical protein [Microvirga sp. Mcv34]|uniref:hypothetical protein n=1 Tax=Microvirga sp. Mcv34 TaxID=2926016 RepID=UPI003966AC45